MDNYKPEDVKQLAISLVKLMSQEQKLEFLTLINSSFSDSNNEQIQKISVPISIFSTSLSCFETIVVHLVDNQKISFKIISSVTGRKKSTIYATYYAAKKKFSGNLTIDITSIMIPVSVLAIRKYSVLECITAYLKDKQNLTLTEISEKLSRNYNTIKTIYRRYNQKLKLNDATTKTDESK